MKDETDSQKSENIGNGMTVQEAGRRGGQATLQRAHRACLRRSRRDLR